MDRCVIGSLTEQEANRNDVLRVTMNVKYCGNTEI